MGACLGSLSCSKLCRLFLRMGVQDWIVVGFFVMVVLYAIFKPRKKSGGGCGGSCGSSGSCDAECDGGCGTEGKAKDGV